MLIAIKWQRRNSEVQDDWDTDGNKDETKEKLTECNSDACQDDYDKDCKTKMTWKRKLPKGNGQL